MKLKIERDSAREQFVIDQGERYGINAAFDSESLRGYKAWCDTRAYSVIVSRDNIALDPRCLSTFVRRHRAPLPSNDMKTVIATLLAILAVFQYFLSMVIFLNVLTRLDGT